MIVKAYKPRRMIVRAVPLRTFVGRITYWRIDCPCCFWHGWRPGRVQALNRALEHAATEHRRAHLSVAR